MDEINCILFYSKYSPACKRIMNIISDTQLTLINVCVDSSDIREKLLSKEIDMKVVPSILKIYDDGGIEKFEGECAFKWVEEVISLITPPAQPMQQPMQQPPMQPPIQPPMQPPQQPPMQPPQQPPMQPPQQQPMQQNPKSTHTLISELIAEEDDSEEDGEDFSQYHATTSKVTGIKKGNIMEMAKAMKDSRETSEPGKISGR